MQNKLKIIFPSTITTKQLEILAREIKKHSDVSDVQEVSKRDIITILGGTYLVVQFVSDLYGSTNALIWVINKVKEWCNEKGYSEIKFETRKGDGIPVQKPTDGIIKEFQEKIKKHEIFPTNIYAVVIGINNYEDKNIPNLKFAYPDAESIYKNLTDPLYGKISNNHAFLLKNSKANFKNIRYFIGELLPILSSEEDMVIIYYAGHGSLESSQNYMEKFIVPYDAKPELLRTSAISISELHRLLNSIKCKYMIFFMDCCFNTKPGGRTFQVSKSLGQPELNNRFLEVLTTDVKGRIIITACDANEVALELKDIRHGLFTYYLNEGLKGKADRDKDGIVSVHELYDYVFEKVSNHASDLNETIRPFITRWSGTGRIPLIRLLPTEDEIYLEAEQVYHNNKREEAKELCQRVLELNPNHERAKELLIKITFSLALQAYDSYEQKLKEAKKLCEEVLQLNSNHEKAKELLEKIKGEKGEPGIIIKIKEFYNKYIKKMPISVKLATIIVALLVFLSSLFKPNIDELLSSKFHPTELSIDQVSEFVIKKNIYDKYINKSGRSASHKYETFQRNGKNLIIDHESGLTWQQSGSSTPLTYSEAKNYIQNLRKLRFGGYNDWRLPTFIEAISLIEHNLFHLHIDPLFNKKQDCIWTVNTMNANSAWMVDFLRGCCSDQFVEKTFYVRAVR